jgi:hypothetical protein
VTLIPDCPAGCFRGFQCEDHLGLAEGHEGCRAAGMQCAHAGCPWWSGDSPLAINPFAFSDTIIASTELPEPRRPMLKAALPALHWQKRETS